MVYDGSSVYSIPRLLVRVGLQYRHLSLWVLTWIGAPMPSLWFPLWTFVHNADVAQDGAYFFPYSGTWINRPIHPYVTVKFALLYSRAFFFFYCVQADHRRQ